MLSGNPIIEESVNSENYHKIIKTKLKRPDVADEEAMDLISSLLVIDFSRVIDLKL